MLLEVGLWTRPHWQELCGMGESWALQQMCLRMNLEGEGPARCCPIPRREKSLCRTWSFVSCGCSFVAEASFADEETAPHIAWFTQSTIVNYQRMLKGGIEGWVKGSLSDDEVSPVVAVHNSKIWR